MITTFLFIIHILAAISSHLFFTKKFLYIIVKYFFGIAIHTKNTFQVINLFITTQLLQTIKSIKKTFNEAIYPNLRANSMKIKDSLGVSWLPIYICN